MEVILIVVNTTSMYETYRITSGNEMRQRRTLDFKKIAYKC
jgi:hypothetical protein